MVKQGYKQTEIGVIPEDWDLKHLNDFGDVISGGTPSTSVGEYWDGDIAWCTPSDITSTMGKYIYKTDRNITHQGLKNSAATILPPNSILLCTRATIGELKLSGVPMATNQGFKNLCPNATGNVDYLYYLLQTKKKDMVELAIGSTFLEISKKALCSIALQTPSLPEQECIAEALSDVDSMISSLEKLIEKKKSVKQGTMQELLTGKKRLPGFVEKWEYKTIRDVSTIYGRIGFRGYTKEDIVEPYKGAISLSPSNISNGKINFNNSTFISWKKYNESPEIMLKPNDVVFVKTGSTYGKSALAENFGWPTTVNPQIIIFKNIKINPKLFALIIQHEDVQKQIESVVVGGAIPTLSQEMLYNFKIYIPCDIAEQTAIVSILSDMDNEIEALEQKLEKTRQIKQGMMQQLLTGKIRLV